MKTKFQQVVFATIVAAPVFGAPFQAHGVGVLSQYGQIQNVQNYSSNPFWSPDAPYNQRMPQVVYVSGPDINTSDCVTIVANLVSVQCAVRNNCRDARLTDIRPAVMLELSRLPGHNFASACAGYIDTVFDEYMKNNVHVLEPAGFPDTAGKPQPEQVQIEIKNPYAIKTPKWADGVKERTEELKNLQEQQKLLQQDK